MRHAGWDLRAAAPPELAPFDVAVYTSALEHLPREQALASLRNTCAALRPGGVMFLSTPNTPGPAPRPLRHRVHVYEWNNDELLPVLVDCGFAVQDIVGLLRLCGSARVMRSSCRPCRS